MIGGGIGVTKIERRGYDSDAQAYFDLVGDIPVYAKNAINKRIKAFKANGTWTGLTQLLFFPPTENISEGLRDAKTLAVTAEFQNSNAAISSPYISAAVMVTADGLYFPNSGGDGAVKTNWIPSTNMTLNSSAYALCFPIDDNAVANFSFGAFQGASQSLAFQKRDASNNCYADMYNNTNNQGRAIQSGTANGAKGVYIVNRTSATNMKITKNGTTIATSTGGGGSLPTVSTKINQLG